MHTLVLIFISLYGILLLLIFIYSISQIALIRFYLKAKKKSAHSIHQWPAQMPKVTIQLPIFNERYVVERLINQVCKIEYPADLVEIQVLDDSTDDTYEIIQKIVAEKQKSGIDIIHVHRTDRKGYKAGALKEGLAKAKGELIAIFDADFLPDKNFLKNTLHYFAEPEIGMVQTRWTHVNENASLLTRLQAFGLNAHFTLEQVGRNEAGAFINFNGTAGVWRKKCIEDAGNWEADTLTEDLDLSYRAQLRNWKFLYLEHVESPAELPPVMSALKTQQYRWTKGGAECAKKNLGKVLRSDKSSLVKWLAFSHLMNSGIFLCILLVSFFSVPVLFIHRTYPEYLVFFYLGSVFTSSYLILFLFYYFSIYGIQGNKLKSFWKTFYLFPLFLMVSMGLSFHNAIAVFEGYRGKRTPFLRTPKFNQTNNNSGVEKNTYLIHQLSWLNIAEAGMILYSAFAIFYAIKHELYGMIHFHILICIGYAIVFWLSLKRQGT